MPRPEGRQREVQRTLRVGVGGATGRVSRERSNRGGADWSEASQPLPRPKEGLAYFERVVNIVFAYLEKRWASALGATWLLDAS